MTTASVAEAIDKLTYINYKHNRRLDATMPSDWKLIYGDEVVDEMERKYQQEQLDQWINDRLWEAGNEESANDPQHV